MEKHPLIGRQVRQNPWISFDFKDREVVLIHYTLQSSQEQNNDLVGWEIAGTRDATTWEVIDARDDVEFAESTVPTIFECRIPSDGIRFYRYIQLTLEVRDKIGNA
jgi:hypothetical protein